MSLLLFVLLSISPLLGSLGFTDLDAREVFDRHRATILALGTHRFDGFVFASVREPVGQRSVSHAAERASLRAAELFLLAATGDPARCIDEPRLRAQFAAAAILFRSMRFDGSGLELVHQSSSAGSVTLVQALPAKAIDGRTIPCDQLIANVCGLAAEPKAPLALAFLALEIAPASMEAASRAWAQRALARGHPTLAAQSQHTSWSALPTGHLTNDAPSKTLVIEALTFSNARPGNLAAAEYARKVLREAGYTRSAELIRLPTHELVPLSDEQRTQLNTEVQLCLTKLTATDSAANWLKLLAKFGAGLPLPSPGDPVPAAASQHFRENALAQCLVALLPNSVPGVESWNLASVCLRQLGARRLAIEAACLVQQLDPMQPFAPVNELLARMAMNDRAGVQRRLVEVRELKTLNEWGQKKLAEVQAWLDAPSSIAAPVGEGTSDAVPTTDTSTTTSTTHELAPQS